MNLSRRILHFLIALDQLIYVIVTLGYGYPDETLSSAAWRAEQDKKILGRIFRPLIDLLFRPFMTDHCRKAYEEELLRLQLPSKFRQNTSQRLET